MCRLSSKVIWYWVSHRCHSRNWVYKVAFITWFRIPSNQLQAIHKQDLIWSRLNLSVACQNRQVICKEWLPIEDIQRSHLLRCRYHRLGVYQCIKRWRQVKKQPMQIWLSWILFKISWLGLAPQMEGRRILAYADQVRRRPYCSNKKVRNRYNDRALHCKKRNFRRLLKSHSEFCTKR